MFCHQGVKQSSLHWEAILQTAGSPGGRGSQTSTIGGIQLVYDLNGKHRKLCQTIFPPLNIPFFIILFYFPCLFVWCWKSLWMPPPTPLSGGSGEVLVKPSSALAHLSSFSFLNRGMRGQKERRLSGFSPLLNHLSLPNLFVFPSVYLCSLSQETQLFVQTSAWTLSQNRSSWFWWSCGCIGETSFDWVRFSHMLDWNTSDLESTFTCNSLSFRFNWWCKSEGITMRSVCLPLGHMRGWMNLI